ncbi:PIN domain-containing protein [Flavobacterium oreochromis]|uniref:PIN domain-containing protein n=1 Tax=Flavobacterium oreochromis TaxID=2906078 RepID=UPI00385E1B89
MAKLVLDTCSWIELAKPKFSNVLEELENQIENGITRIISCDLIIEEWERNKSRIISNIKNSIKEYSKSAINISNYLPKKEKTKLIYILEKYRDREDEQIKLAEKHFNRIEKLINSSTKYTISDELKLEVIKKAIKKEVPFHNSKNNINDALIYFGAIEYMQSFIIANDLIFVTQNISEFSDTNNRSLIHPDLKVESVHYSTNLADALKMRKEDIDELDEYNEYKFENWVDIQVDEI